MKLSGFQMIKKKLDRYRETVFRIQSFAAVYNATTRQYTDKEYTYVLHEQFR